MGTNRDAQAPARKDSTRGDQGRAEFWTRFDARLRRCHHGRRASSTTVAPGRRIEGFTSRIVGSTFEIINSFESIILLFISIFIYHID